MRVLVIDDDDALRSEITEYFRRRDHIVSACGSVSEAQRTLGQMLGSADPPDAVICDVRLSDGSGIDFCMSHAQRVPTARWIIMSGGYDHEHVATREGAKANLPAFRLVNKPLSLRVLLALAVGP